jgi:hypothetical protein
MSNLVKQVMRSGALALVAALAVPAIAAADAPDVTPNSMSASSKAGPNNTVIVTVQGGWQWTTHKSNCNTDRAGVGVAIDWNDTNQPGNVVTTLNGVTIDVGVKDAGGLNPQDNAVHPTLGSTFSCGVYGAFNTGAFGSNGEFTHTYAADALPPSICALTYDVHGKPGVPNGVKETTAGGNNNNDDNSAQKNGATPAGNICATVPIVPPPPPPPPPGCTANCTPAPALPVIAIDKSGPASALAGTTVEYSLVVTDPGPTSFPAAKVSVTDAMCNAVPVLVTKNGDSSPDFLNPGDSWSYTCSVATQLGQDAIHNTGDVTGTDTNGNPASASDTADTVLNQPASGVAPLLPGVARLRGPTGCVSNASHVLTVRGKRIARVSFYIDGRYVGTRTKPNRGAAYTVTVRGSRLRKGAHRVVARVTYTPDTNPRTRTLTLAFARCARAVQPKFTG